MANRDTMASSLPSVGFEFPDAGSSGYLLYFISAFTFAILFWSLQTPKSSAPHLNPRGPFEMTNARTKKEFVSRGSEILYSWFRTHPTSPARMISDFGEVTVLPPEMADAIRNDDRLSFSKWTFNTFHARYPGFEGFREGSRDSDILKTVVQRDLTKSLNKVTEPLTEETILALSEYFSDNQEWHNIPLRETILRVIARISSRVFLGDELCRNEDWLRISREYTQSAFRAAEDLRLWPPILRPIVHWFLPKCKNARAQVLEARRIIEPVLQKRRKLKAEKEGQVHFEDAIEWFEQVSNGRDYDPAISQLILSMAAIHTTTDLACKVILDLARHPEMLEPLRQEITEVIKNSGWTKQSMYNMKLLDSVIKETQRLTPIGNVSMRRVALENIELPDGTTFPKHSILAVSSHKLRDPNLYENPEKWDGYRFYNMREMPGKENVAQLVSTSSNYLAFGHGKHACPGRFFAANEIKIALIHILDKYDFKLPKGMSTEPRVFGFSLNVNPFAQIEIRRRKENML